MGVNRRQFLLGGLGLAAAATTMGLTGCAPGSSSSGGGGGDAGTADLAFTWWGNDVRNKNTTAAIDAYIKANPGVKIAPQPGECAQLLGQAGHPDRRQHRPRRHPDGHGLHLRVRQPAGPARPVRGRHLEVHRGHRRLGQDQRHACTASTPASTAWSSSPTRRSSRRPRMDVPDDKTWTWDSMIEMAAEVASKAKVTFGFQSLVSANLFQPGSGSTARSCSPPTPWASTSPTLTGWFDYLVKAQKAGAIGSASQITEEWHRKSLDQSAIVVGTAALAVSNSNQLEAITAAAGTEISMLRLPDLAGQLRRAQGLVQGAHAVVRLGEDQEPRCRGRLDRLVGQHYRGRRPSTWPSAACPPTARSRRSSRPSCRRRSRPSQKFIADIKPELATTPIAPPPGGGKAGERAVPLRHRGVVRQPEHGRCGAGLRRRDEVESAGLMP